MSLDSSIDPDIQAAFGSQQQSDSTPNVDSDIADAFKDARTDKPARPGHAPPVAGNPLEYAWNSVVGGAENVVSGVTGGVGSLADAVTGSDPGTHNWAYQPRTEAGKEIAQGSSKLLSQAGNKIADATGMSQPLRDTLAERVPEAVGAVGTAVPILKGAAGLVPADSFANRPISQAVSGPPGTAPLSAEEAVAQSRAGQSMGAAADGGSATVSKLTPETQAEISRAAQQGLPLNQTAIERHADAESLPLPEGTTPLRLRKGQATGDSQQISDEKNLRADPDTQGILTDSITDQDQKLVASMGEIRRQATPDIVQRINAEHDQAAIDSIKSQDNSMVLDTRAKYKALSDANGGTIPIDTGSAISTIDGKLQKGYLTKTAQSNPVISSVMDDLRSGQPMDFESYENARSRLADVQRQGGSDGVAAGIVRNQLENLPLPAEAAPLKGLADSARASAQAHFDWIKQNPAVKAAVEDNVPKENGLHVIGDPSPLAGSFLDRYALGNGPNATPAYVARLKQAVPDPVLSDSIEAATLNKLRDAAGIDSTGNGSFRNAQFRNAVNDLESKESVLLKPDTANNIQQLKRVGGYVNDEGKAATVNRSNTALTLQRFGAMADETPTVTGQLASYGGDIAAIKLGPVGVVAKRIGETAFKNSKNAKAIQAMKDAKLNFATDATKPGAGISP